MFCSEYYRLLFCLRFRCVCLNDADRWTPQQLLDHSFLKPPSPKNLPQYQDASSEGGLSVDLFIRHQQMCRNTALEEMTRTIIKASLWTCLPCRLLRLGRGLCINNHSKESHPRCPLHLRSAEAAFSLLQRVRRAAASWKGRLRCRHQGIKSFTGRDGGDGLCLNLCCSSRFRTN